MRTKRFYLTIADRQVHGRVAGTGPTVVLLPDLPGGAPTATELVEALAPSFQVFTLDASSLGSEPEQDGSVEELAQEMARWLDALGVAQTHVVGTGSGAVLALVLANALPQRCASVVLNELPVYDDRERAARVAAERPLPAPSLDGSHLVAAFHRVRDSWLFDPWYDQGAVTRRVDMPGPDVLHAATMEVLSAPDAFTSLRRTLLRVDTRSELQALSCPAFVASEAAGGAGGLVPDGVRGGSIEDLQAHRERMPAAVLSFLRDQAPLPEVERPATAARRTGITRSYLDTPWGQIHVRSAGRTTSARPLVMLHSAPGSAEPLESAMLALAQDRLVVAPDFLGNGDSDKPDPQQPVDIAFLARVLSEALHGLPEDRFDLWGSHTGGLVAMEMAIADPVRFPALILDAVPLLDPEETKDILEHYLPPIVLDPHGTHLLAAWHMRRDMFVYWPWYNRRGSAVRPMLLPDVTTFHDWTLGLLRSGTTYHRSYRAAFEYPTAERLPLISVPTLLCSGPSDMLAGGLEAARALGAATLEIASAPATVWYPRQEPTAVRATLDMYRHFLDEHR